VAHVARIASLHVYPIKSCGGISAGRAFLDWSGLEHDREFVLIDSNGKFLSQRTVPKMCLIRTSLGDDELVVQNHDRDCKLVIPLGKAAGEPKPIDIWGRTGSGIDGT
jgi:uncharacterized protein YcbX